MPIVLDGSLGLTTPTYGGADTSEYLVPVTQFKNRIINGAMVISQRYGTTATANTISDYTLDRWNAVQTTSGKLIVQQNAGSVTTPSGFPNYLGVTSQSAYTVGSSDAYLIFQPIEGFNFADMAWGTANAQAVTLSFWVRSSLTGTFGGSLRNSALNRSYPFTYTISSANTWEQKSVTIAGDTSGTWVGATNGVGVYVGFSLGAGSTFSGTAGAWAGSNLTSATGATSVVGTNGATFYITGVQLEVGSTATSFDYRPYGTELALCQRYFQLTTSSIMFAGTTNGTTQVSNIGVPMQVAMRATPTASSSNYDVWSASNGAVSMTGATMILTYATGATIARGNVTGFSGLTDNRNANINTGFSLQFSAEL